MNAKELHELYAPLWEKVPECKPPHTICVGVADVDMEFEYWGDDNRRDDRDHSIPITLAAALCRVAVEDWLIAEGGFLSVHMDHDDPEYSPNEEYSVAPLNPGCPIGENYHCGPTIHHALVQAALAVAGANPSPPA